MNTFAKALGFRRDNWDGSWRSPSVDITWAFGFGLKLGLFGDGEGGHFSLFLALIYPRIWIRLDFLQRWAYDPFDIMNWWGIEVQDDCIAAKWGQRTHRLFYPWRWRLDANYFYDNMGQLVPAPDPDMRSLTQTFPYYYILGSGATQRRMATVHAERTDWVQVWLAWLGWPRKVRTFIHVEFDEEIGEDVGTHKGGCVACDYDWDPKESMLSALRRMESERRF